MNQSGNEEISMFPNSDVIEVPCKDDIISRIALQVITDFKTSLPDLSNVIVVLPDQNSRQYFREKLLEQLTTTGTNSVLSPWTGTLKDWVNENIALPDAKLTVIPDQTRRLLLIDALSERPALFRKENIWQVCDSLLKLFDELIVNNIGCIEGSAKEWQETIANAYDIDPELIHLSHEAQMVYTLWHAWQEQLKANNFIDAIGSYKLKIQHLCNKLPKNSWFYVAHTASYNRIEKDFFDILHKNNKLTQYAYSTTSRDNNNELGNFLTRAFQINSAPLKERVESYIKDHPLLSPETISLPFSLFKTKNSEIEAQAIELQIRKWIIEGKTKIGIISADRKLSRRVRALLERSHISIEDISGWSLATTSAAAIIERWFECLEEDFNFRPFIDLLKSHFITTDETIDEHRELVYRFENDIVLHENISHGLDRYKQHLKFRNKKLKQKWSNEVYKGIETLINNIDTLSRPLLKLYQSKTPQPASLFVETFIKSLHDLNIYASFEKDDAGIRIIETLSDIQISANTTPVQITWQDFRMWLGLVFEEQLFKPQFNTTNIQLMSLEQAYLHKFDAVILAAANSNHLPGKVPSTPFFNQNVKKSLLLPTWEEKRQDKLKSYLKLLQSSEEILITCTTENNGEEIPLSNWVQTLCDFYQLTHHKSINNNEIQVLLDHCLPAANTDYGLPNPPAQPEVINKDFKLNKVSVSGYQQLMNCPYQFFANKSLSLKPAEEIQDELRKSDYGSRIHLILQSFHTEVGGIKPFTKPVTQNNRDEAIDYLKKISKEIFHNDLEDNVLHRSWLLRWNKHVPAYIDWEINRQQNWKVSSTEQNLEVKLENTTLYGRLDRIDINANQNNAIIDYKTGKNATQKDVQSGEDVQLSSYSALLDTSKRVEFLSLDETKDKVKSGACLEENDLKALQDSSTDRLVTLVKQIHEGIPMTAWGDEKVCGYCDFIGLCRRPFWINENE